MKKVTGCVSSFDVMFMLLCTIMGIFGAFVA